MSNSNQKANLKPSKGGVTPEKGGPMGGHNEYRRTGQTPTPGNTGAVGKPSTPKPY